MTESFNAFVVKVREKPVFTLLEWIRRKTMTRFQQRYEKAVALATPIPSKARERINRNQKEGRKLLCFRGSDHLFEVNDSKNYVVNLQEMSCQCREWQISGVPCKHALCCMTHIRDDPTRFVHPLLTRDFYVKSYSKTINPAPDESKWPAVDHPVVCPREDIEKQRGRKPKKIKRELDEQPAKKRSVHCTCTICHQIGHNSRTCGKKQSTTNEGGLHQNSI
ncbi:uncharacterized protein LOC132639844 [Lycium barbarum]|uniref:uncharacterized protein LOC132639844 n=1 Tax=Lycium barbarum TaxID=112863 RepID=UPI00293F1016|nr:uncharacterized protein LOC132639844 [Lycium barbarum]